MTRAESSMRRKCNKNHCSAISNSAWTDLNSQGNILKLHDKCPNPNCNCQKINILHHINICSKMDRLKLNYGKFLEEHKQLGISF